MQRKTGESILVLGAGNFGTCLAQHLARQGHSVTIWSRRQEIVDSINKNHRNSCYLTSLDLSVEIKAVRNLESALKNAPGTLVMAIPAQSLRQVLTGMKGLTSPGQLMVCAAKGIEVGTGMLPSHVVREILGPEIAEASVSLSGPSFAVEIAAHQPTGVSVASLIPSRSAQAQKIFHSPRFRAYTCEDPTGLEVAGALKNVIAIASGACAGLNFGANSQATLITRGLAEMTRIGTALGANPLTFKGLGGVGDLYLTCSSEKSRNYTVGFQLGLGKKLSDVLKDLGSVAEGVATTKSAYNLAQKVSVMAPITTAVYDVLYNDAPIMEVVSGLMGRDAKPEFS